MITDQTAATVQNSGTSTSPFSQIQELEQRENDRVEKEISAMAKEKDDVQTSLIKKGEQAIEDLKDDAKKDLKKHSETELSPILMTAKKESETQCQQLESISKGQSAAAINSIVAQAKDPNFLFATKA